jgi:hypothetical protein
MCTAWCRIRNSAPTRRAPVPDRLCTVAMRPAATAGQSSPKASLRERAQKVGSPPIGAYSCVCEGVGGVLTQCSHSGCIAEYAEEISSVHTVI